MNKTELFPTEQKMVRFNDADILGVKANDGKVYIGVRWICRGMGLTDGQYQNQTRKINDDIVLSKGIANLQLPTNGGIQDVLCIELDFLPLWLAKISITPTIIRENPEMAEKLVDYQLRAKDVLAQAFIEGAKHPSPKDVEDFLFNPDTVIRLAENWKSEQKLRIAAEHKIEEDKPKVVFADSFVVSDDAVLVREFAKILKQNGIDMGEKRLFSFLRDNGYLIKKFGSDWNSPTQKSMNLGLFQVKDTLVHHHSGRVTITKTPKITGKGQFYFINKFKGEGPSEGIN